MGFAYFRGVRSAWIAASFLFLNSAGLADPNLEVPAEILAYKPQLECLWATGPEAAQDFAPLPKSIPPPLDRRDPKDLFDQTWKFYGRVFLSQRPQVEALLLALIDAPTAEQMAPLMSRSAPHRASLKAWRKAASALRSAFLTCDGRHEVPELFGKFVRVFGQLNDLVGAASETPGNKESRKIAESAAKTLALLRSIDQDGLPGLLEAASGESFYEHVGRILLKIAEQIKGHELVAHDFHDIRKRLRDLKVMYEQALEQGVEDTKKVQKVIAYLEVINKQMGGINDALILRRNRDRSFDYDHFVIPTPELVRQEIHLFIQRYFPERP